MTVIITDSDQINILNEGPQYVVQASGTAFELNTAVTENVVSSTRAEYTVTSAGPNYVVNAQVPNQVVEVSLSQHLSAVSDVDGLESALDAKVNVSGGTMTGALTAPEMSVEFIGGSSIKADWNVAPFKVADAYDGWGIGATSIYNSDVGYIGTLSDRLYLDPATEVHILSEGRVFSDGYHPNADTLTTARTIILGGDLSGSASFDGSANITINATVADDSHSHTISNVNGLQTELDSKVDNLGGVASGLSLSKYIILSDYDDSVSLNTGIRSYVRDGTWHINQHISETNPIQISIGGQQVFHDGYHPNADKWTTARTLTLNGDVSGSVAFDGSGNPTMTVTVANDSHTHDGRYYTESESNSRFVNVTGDTMTGDLNLQSHLRIGSGGATGGGAVAQISSTGNRFYIAPTNKAGSYAWSKEFTYDPDGDAVWTAEGGFKVTGATTITGGLTVETDLYCNSGWLRTYGSRGWYNQTYGGGVYMTDTTWVRTYNNKGFFTTTDVRADGNILVNSAEGITSRTGSYGTIQTVDTAGETGWQGYSISGRAVFMHDSSNTTGIYDDVNNKWLFRAGHNAESIMYYNGAARVTTTSGGVDIAGSLTATGQVLTTEVRTRNGQQLILNAGESAGKVSGQTNEYVYVNAEQGLEVCTPDAAHGNWASGYSVDRTQVTGYGVYSTEAFFDTTNNNSAASNVTGTVILANGNLHVSSSNYAVNVNVQTDGGQLIRFRNAGSVRGNISVTGTTVSYNGGHLARYSQLPATSNSSSQLLKGTVMTNLDELCEWTKEDGSPEENEQLNKMEVSSVVGDKNVSGVFVNWFIDENGNDPDMNIAMTGDFIIRIAAGTTVQRGDLLMSAGDGTATPQGDGYVQDKTIAKVTSTSVRATYSDGSYCVPCVLMAC